MLFIVRKGRVKVERVLKDGNQQILRLIGAGDFFGVTALFQEEPLSVNVEAVEPSIICMLEGEQLKSFLIKSPTVLIKIMEQVTKRMRMLEDRLSAVTLKEVDSRLAHYLVEQMNNTTQRFTLSLSKKDLASLLGTSRESISRKLSEFQRLGYILICDHEIEIINRSVLVQIAMK
jgi:CRP/FNR family transcriptional regulator